MGTSRSACPWRDENRGARERAASQAIKRDIGLFQREGLGDRVQR
jgi:hypothetical protein